MATMDDDRAGPATPGLPDFVVIGAMKCGSTSLHQWLAQQPDLFLAPKEVNFFSRESVWARGLGWYRSLYAAALPSQLLGDVSPHYINPDSGATAARRMSQIVPGVRLVLVARDPIERLRSHYRHEVQKNRETRSLVDALRDPGNPYVRRSMYHASLMPYLEHFEREQICCVRFEDLFTPGSPAWPVILRHLGVPDRPCPSTAHNVSAAKPHHTAALRWLRDNGFVDVLLRLPGPVRRVGKALLTRGADESARRLERSRAQLPSSVTEPIWEDVRRLEELLATDRPLWAQSVEGGKITH